MSAIDKSKVKKVKVTIKIRNPAPLMDMLMFIKSGLRSGKVQSNPVMIGMDDPNATEYKMKSLEEMIDEAIKKAW